MSVRSEVLRRKVMICSQLKVEESPRMKAKGCKGRGQDEMEKHLRQEAANLGKSTTMCLIFSRESHR